MPLDSRSRGLSRLLLNVHGWLRETQEDAALLPLNCDVVCWLFLVLEMANFEQIVLLGIAWVDIYLRSA